MLENCLCIEFDTFFSLLFFWIDVWLFFCCFLFLFLWVCSRVYGWDLEINNTRDSRSRCKKCIFNEYDMWLFFFFIWILPNQILWLHFVNSFIEYAVVSYEHLLLQCKQVHFEPCISFWFGRLIVVVAVAAISYESCRNFD